MSADRLAPQRVVLVGCGKMGTALLRGWVAKSAAARFEVVEPAGPPPALATEPAVSWHRSPVELPDAVAPEAVVFAVKPQIMPEVAPAYRRWA